MGNNVTSRPMVCSSRKKKVRLAGAFVLYYYWRLVSSDRQTNLPLTDLLNDPLENDSPFVFNLHAETSSPNFEVAGSLFQGYWERTWGHSKSGLITTLLVSLTLYT